MAQQPSILLIDDNAATNFLHTRVLRKSGLVGFIKAFTGGVAALEYLRVEAGTTASPLPDFIFLDINMPGMSGWEFLAAYQELPLEKRGGIIIIMLTTSLNPDDALRAEQIEEISGFQQKPLMVEHLQQIIEKHLDKR